MFYQCFIHSFSFLYLWPNELAVHQPLVLLNILKFLFVVFLRTNKPPVLQKLERVWLVRWLLTSIASLCCVEALALSLELSCIFSFLIISKRMHKNANQSRKLDAALLSLMEVPRFCV